MRGSKEKNLMISTTTANSNCFSSILKSFTCGGNLPSPAPSDHDHHHHHVLPKFKSNGYIHPNPNELPNSEPTSTNPHFLDHNESLEPDFAKDDNPRQPGLVARLMGLESMPNYQDSIMNLRSKSLNSLHLYIFPDTFLDHVSPSPQFSQHQRRKPCHLRAQSTSPILCVEPSPSKEKTEPYTCNVEEGVIRKPEMRRRNGGLSKRKKVDQENESKPSNKNDRKKALENKVDATKCRVSEDQRTRKRISQAQRDDPRKEIKYKDFGTKLSKERGVCRIRNADELKIKVDEKGHHRNHVSVFDRRRDSKDDSAVRPRRRRSSRKIVMDQQKNNQGQNSRCFQGKKLCSKTREDTEDCKELMAQVIRLTEEEHVRDDEWINFDENGKEFGVDFAGEMLQVLINQFLDELLR